MLLDRKKLKEILIELNHELQKKDIKAELFVVGGAAITLVYNSRRATRDVDAIFEPKMGVYDAAKEVANNHDFLDEDWLNDGVKGLLIGKDDNSTVAFEASNLSVRAASAKYLFAMKIAASRIERDTDDIKFLYKECQFKTADDALNFVIETYPNIKLLPKSQFLLEEIALELDKKPTKDET